MQCVDYRDKARLQLNRRTSLPEVDCFSVHWEASHPGSSLKDCILMDTNFTGVWWGLGDVTGGSLPLSSLQNMEKTRLYTAEIQKHRIGGLLRKVLISSKGVSITIPSASKVFFSVESASEKDPGKFCLESDPDTDMTKRQNLDYTICAGKDVYSILRNLNQIEAIDNIEFRSSKWHTGNRGALETISRMPEAPQYTKQEHDQAIFRMNCPIWRPWLPHHIIEMGQEDVMNYVRGIIKRNHFDMCGYVLLPSTWQDKLGNFDFDKKRFPNPKSLSRALSRVGLRLAITLSPLIDTDSYQFMNFSKANFLIRQTNSTLPILVSTKRSTAAGVMDFTNPNLANWFSSKLKELKDMYDIDGFHLTPVNTLSLPPYRQQHSHQDNADYAAREFIAAVSKVKPPISTETAVIPVKAPTYLTAADGDGGWSMLTMLPNRVLSISSVGGSLVDSGVIGGWSDQKGHIPDADLYLRWLQCSIFLPAFQISVLPHMYDSAMEMHVKKLMQMRRRFVIPRFRRMINETLKHDYPLVSPLAIMFPKDIKAITIRDQWFIGQDLMVAPILRRGRSARDLYLPDGIWKDGLDDRLLEG